MRQAGIVAAGALYALDHHVERLADDHALARELAAGLAGSTASSSTPDAVETNIVVFGVEDAPALVAALERGRRPHGRARPAHGPRGHPPRRRPRGRRGGASTPSLRGRGGQPRALSGRVGASRPPPAPGSAAPRSARAAALLRRPGRRARAPRRRARPARRGSAGPGPPRAARSRCTRRPGALADEQPGVDVPRVDALLVVARRRSARRPSTPAPARRCPSARRAPTRRNRRLSSLPARLASASVAHATPPVITAASRTACSRVRGLPPSARTGPPRTAENSCVAQRVVDDAGERPGGVLAGDAHAPQRDRRAGS